MPVQTSYPGVYVQEVPSGARTIAGVATSMTLFIGRAAQGPINEPVLCLNPSDFERVFSNDATFSELPRAIRLFYQNGGSRCYVVRIADGAIPASINLHGEDGSQVLGVSAKSPGAIGNTIRLGVTYGGPHPESTFNLEVFRWQTNNVGRKVKVDREFWLGLSMDPSSPKYAQSFVTQNSNLIDVVDLNAGTESTDTSISRSCRAIPTNEITDAFFDITVAGISSPRLNDPWSGTSAVSKAGIYGGSTSKRYTFNIEGTGGAPLTIGTDTINIQWSDGLSSGTIQLDSSYVADTAINVNEGLALSFGAGDLREGDSFSVFVHPPSNHLRMSIDGGRSWTDVSFNNRINLTNETNLVDSIRIVLEEIFSAGAITTSFENSSANHSVLQFSSTEGDIRIEPAPQNDLARVLMLGSAQGGIEISRYASRRPAPNGTFFNLDNWFDFAELQQDDFDSITVAGRTIPLQGALQTVQPANTSHFFEDGQITSASGGFDGVREKMSVLANTINTFAMNNAGYNWSAEVQGQRLMIVNPSEGDNIMLGLSIPVQNVGPFFQTNIQYYGLGPSGSGGFRTQGNIGDDGQAPTLNNYREAFTAVEREVDLFNLLVLPRDADHDPATIASLWGPASVFCQHQRAFLIIDPPENWNDVQSAVDPTTGVNKLRIGLVDDHSAVFYPRVIIRENGLRITVGPAGAIAGLMGRIDNERGVWKAPAGIEADLRDIVGLERRFSDQENGVLNPKAINTLRIFPNGIVSWGARTLAGDDEFPSDWKYIPIRRLALFIEESLYRGLKWVVFEPNDEPLWSQIRLNVGAFMHDLFRQGAFQGEKKSEAYFVKCDRETTTQNDRNLGIVNIWVGFAPLKPAEFVIIKLQQMAGQIEV